MKAKKIVIAVLMAALVIGLIISCNDPLENLNSEEADISAPPGKSIIRLNFTNPNSGLTVMPTGLPSGLASFNTFTLAIIDVTHSNTPVAPPAPYNAPFLSGDFTGVSNNQIALTLNSGASYKFTLTAYLGSKKAALGETTTSVLGSNSSVSVTLKEIKTGGADTGTFSWNVTTTFTDPITNASVSYGTASLTLTNLVGATTPISDEDLLTTPSGSDTAIPSGIYRMTINLGKPNYQSVVVQEIVHIYSAYTSTYSGTLPDLRSTLHKITYNYNDVSNTLVISKPSENVVHGSTIPSASFTVSHSSVSPGPVTHSFAGWFTDDSTFLNEITDATKILRPLILNAKWAAISTITVTVNAVMGFPVEFVPTPSVSITSFDQDLVGTTISFTVEVTNGTGWDFTWKDDQGTTLTTTTGTAQSTVNLTLASDVNWWQLGGHNITLEATDGTYTYNGTVTITCDFTP